MFINTCITDIIRVYLTSQTRATEVSLIFLFQFLWYFELTGSKISIWGTVILNCCWFFSRIIFLFFVIVIAIILSNSVVFFIYKYMGKRLCNKGKRIFEMYMLLWVRYFVLKWCKTFDTRGFLWKTF